MKIGIKLYSTDTVYIPEVKTLNEKGVFDYIELYVVPYTHDSSIQQWKDTDCNFIIHAPHTAHGVNLAKSELRSANINIYYEVKRYCDDLKSPYIVVHGGSDGTLDETIKQLKMINDNRIRLENKPLRGLHGEICRGCSPEEISKILELANLEGMTLDFGHAICYSASAKLDFRETIREFMKFTPSMYHISDGIFGSQTDVHLNIGGGNFSINELLNYVNKDDLLSLETPRKCKDDLRDFVEDVRQLRMLRYNAE